MRLVFEASKEQGISKEEIDEEYEGKEEDLLAVNFLENGVVLLSTLLFVLSFLLSAPYFMLFVF
jgi:hypothetical protein